MLGRGGLAIQALGGLHAFGMGREHRISKSDVHSHANVLITDMAISVWQSPWINPQLETLDQQHPAPTSRMSLALAAND